MKLCSYLIVFDVDAYENQVGENMKLDGTGFEPVCITAQIYVSFKMKILKENLGVCRKLQQI
jgi:hypothetical protein